MPVPDPIQNFVAYMAQIALIAAAASVLLRLLSMPSPGLRHAAWRIALVTCLGAPWLLRSGVPPPVADTLLPVEVAAPLEMSDIAVQSVMATTPPPPSIVPWRGVVVVTLAAGLILRVSWLMLGLFRLRRLRRAGVDTAHEDDGDLQRVLGTRASIRSVAGLAQPVTFGVLRPVVLLPAALDEAPAELRRAIVTHELFHVQRRDWVWVLMEELLRAALWFHPAIWWLISRIQATREELVDQLTVLATGDRKVYIKALLTFADAGRVHPAPALARRAHLFTRIISLSKESVMPSTRVVLSGALVVTALAVSGWYASEAFPVVAASTDVSELPDVAAPAPFARRSPPSDRRAHTELAQAVLRAELRRRTELASRQSTSAAPGTAAPFRDLRAEQDEKISVTPENPIPRRLYAGPLEYPADYAPFRYQAAVEVQVVLDAAGVPMRVEAGATALTVALAGAPQEPDRRIVMDAFRTAAVDAVKQWRYDAPVQAPLLFWVEISFRSGEPVRVSQNSVSRGVWATRDAVGFGAMAPPPPPVATARFRPEVVYDAAGNRREVPVSVYAAADAQVNAQIAEIAALQEQLKVLRTRQADVLAQLPKERPSDLGQPARSSDLVVDRIKELEMQLVAARRAVDGSLTLSGRTPVRVDGDRVKAPTKLKNVPPAYPAIAMSARVQGTVVLEVLVDEQGHVADARVLRSIPLLDAAAIEAVRQWEFTPTLLDGSPQPIFMTVTVQFSLN